MWRVVVVASFLAGCVTMTAEQQRGVQTLISGIEQWSRESDANYRAARGGGAAPAEECRVVSYAGKRFPDCGY